MTQKRETIIAAALLFALICLMTYPVIGHFGSRVVGVDSDLWTHLWGYYWTEHSLLDLGEVPFRLDFVNYPVGGALYHVDFLNSLLMLPLKAAFGLAAGYNILVFAQLLLGGLAMFFLARKFASGFAPCLFAAFAYISSSYVISWPLASGVSERLNIGWLPLYFLFLHQLTTRGGLRNAVFAALMFGLALLGNWKFGLFIFILTVLYLAAVFIGTASRREVGVAQIKPLIKRYAWLAAGCAVAALPLTRLAGRSVESQTGLLHRAFRVFWDGQSPLPFFYHFSFKDYFSAADSSLHIVYGEDLLFQSVYIGFAVLLLAAASLWNKKGFARFFLPAGVIFLFLSLGPFIFFTPREYVSSVFYQALLRVVPFLIMLTETWEFTFPAGLCLCLGAAVGLETILDRAPGKFRVGIGIAAILLLLVERLFIAPIPMPVPSSEISIPAFYSQLAQKKGRGAIFDYPMSRDPKAYAKYGFQEHEGDFEKFPTQYYLYQTVHKRQIPYVVNGSWLYEDPFWSAMNRYHKGRADSLPGGAEQALSYLARHKFEYFILHKTLMDVPAGDAEVDFFESLLGAPEYRDDELVVFRIGEE